MVTEDRKEELALAAASRDKVAKPSAAPTGAEADKSSAGGRPKKLSYKEQQEWDTIEGRIAKLEEQIAVVQAELAKGGTDYTHLQKLTADQEAKAQQLLHAMFSESRPKSARLLEAEAKLRRLFAERAADAASVRAAVAEVERARSEVRLVHLLTHLRTRDLLTEDQRRIYHEARWSALPSASTPPR